jgi:histidinol-phosphatase
VVTEAHGPESDLSFAQRLADLADRITLPRFLARAHIVETKPDRTPVTETDLDVERAIRAAVGESRRAESVLGEEFGDDGGEDRWIVDPIDGTTSFLRGVPIWGTLLALERNRIVELALVSAPALGRRWWALKGGGAFVDGEPCHVSGVSRLEDAAVSNTSQRRMPPGWLVIVQRARSNRGLGDFWQHCLVAEGCLDVAVDGPYIRIWDYSAVKLLVEEAGGRCTTMAGGEPADRDSFVSTNGHVHSEVIELLGGA